MSKNNMNNSCLFISSAPHQHICQVLLPEAPESVGYWREKGEFLTNTLKKNQMFKKENNK